MALAKNKQFSSFGLDNRLFKAISKQGLVNPTLIQSECIPIALEGRDVLAKARTGSGKTLAYAIPMIQRILSAKKNAGQSAPGVKGLVLVPTNELVEQVKDVFRALLYYAEDLISLYEVTGDKTTSLASQVPSLRASPDILIATPGRLVDHLQRGNISLVDSLQVLVLDEADLILSYGYEEDMQTLVEYLPKLHQTLLMSATLSEEVDKLKSLVMHSPAILKLQENEEQDKLKQFYLRCKDVDKFLVAFALLKLGSLQGKTIFFVNSVDRCYRLKLFLEQFSVSSAILNAELPMNCRQHILQQFNNGLFDHLIATDDSLNEEQLNSKKKPTKGKGKKNDDDDEDEDGETKNDDEDDDDDEDKDEDEDEDEDEDKDKEDKDEDEDEDEVDEEEEKKTVEKLKKIAGYGVARGVDFKFVSTVVNFDFPTSVKNYVHRIGRTARGGASGFSLSLVNPDEEQMLAGVMQYLAGDGEIERTEATVKPLDFNLREIEGFRYRVESALRSVTKIRVRDARLKELKVEMLNSQKLKSHFEDNPRELELLKHDKALSTHIQPTLATIPEYLMPRNLAAPNLSVDTPAKQYKKKRPAPSHKDSKGKRRKHSRDPLKSFGFSTRTSKHVRVRKPVPSNMPADPEALKKRRR
eukprot:TRINITY_DN1955_c0_g1_i5.p1 TRINITY_DN1955_c0_g1~~TRINITY_DN1955_c0_g1_i5.p1  ORF type:complete len:640 (-),score=151.93 TRINITY_DN1955_c0_g1_i5:109-2028(-)